MVSTLFNDDSHQRVTDTLHDPSPGPGVQQSIGKDNVGSRTNVLAPEADARPVVARQYAPAPHTVVVALLQGEGQRGKHVRQVVTARRHCELCARLVVPGQAVCAEATARGVSTLNVLCIQVVTLDTAVHQVCTAALQALCIQGSTKSKLAYQPTL